MTKQTAQAIARIRELLYFVELTGDEAMAVRVLAALDVMEGRKKAIASAGLQLAKVNAAFRTERWWALRRSDPDAVPHILKWLTELDPAFGSLSVKRATEIATKGTVREAVLAEWAVEAGALGADAYSPKDRDAAIEKIRARLKKASKRERGKL